jgi:hypothetical protein
MGTPANTADIQSAVDQETLNGDTKLKPVRRENRAEPLVGRSEMEKPKWPVAAGDLRSTSMTKEPTFETLCDTLWL